MSRTPCDKNRLVERVWLLAHKRASVLFLKPKLSLVTTFIAENGNNYWRRFGFLL